MPLFDFRCEACGRQNELLVRGSEEPRCPTCGSDRLHKLLGVPSAHVKGASLPVCEAPAQRYCGQGGCGLPDCRAD